jgi:hypothetical protein
MGIGLCTSNGPSIRTTGKAFLMNVNKAVFENKWEQPLANDSLGG